MKSLSKVGPNLNPLGLNLDVNLGLGLGLDLILVLVHVHVHGFNHLIRNITNINNNNILMQPLMTYIHTRPRRPRRPQNYVSPIYMYVMKFKEK
jgi:hypothetical protein